MRLANKTLCCFCKGVHQEPVWDDVCDEVDESSVVADEATEVNCEATDHHTSCDASTNLDDVVKAFQVIADDFAAMANNYGKAAESTEATVKSQEEKVQSNSVQEPSQDTNVSDEAVESTTKAQEENRDSSFVKALTETKSIAKLWDESCKEWVAEFPKEAKVPDSSFSYVYSIPNEYLQEYKGKNKSEKIENMLKTVRKDFAVLCGLKLACYKHDEDADKLNKDKDELMKAFTQELNESAPRPWKKS